MMIQIRLSLLKRLQMQFIRFPPVYNEKVKFKRIDSDISLPTCYYSMPRTENGYKNKASVTLAEALFLNLFFHNGHVLGEDARLKIYYLKYL